MTAGIWKERVCTPVGGRGGTSPVSTAWGEGRPRRSPAISAARGFFDARFQACADLDAKRQFVDHVERVIYNRQGHGHGLCPVQRNCNLELPDGFGSRAKLTRRRCARGRERCVQSGQPHAHAGSTGGGRALVADDAAREASEDRRQDRASRSLRRVPARRGGGAAALFADILRRIDDLRLRAPPLAA